MRMPPSSRSPRLVFRAAGFIATSTFGWSPGVLMSCDEKLIWYPDTPARVPAGARISAGKSGRVARSLPTRAVVSANWVPVSCMPSPESPANRMTTVSSSVTLAIGRTTSVSVLTVASVSSCARGAGRVTRAVDSAALGRVEDLVQPGRQIHDFGREVLGHIVHDVTRGDQPDPVPALVEQGDVTVPPFGHQPDRLA